MQRPLDLGLTMGGLAAVSACSISALEQARCGDAGTLFLDPVTGEPAGSQNSQ